MQPNFYRADLAGTIPVANRALGLAACAHTIPDRRDIVPLVDPAMLAEAKKFRAEVAARMAKKNER